jgi:hypothetical protein
MKWSVSTNSNCLNNFATGLSSSVIRGVRFLSGKIKIKVMHVISDPYSNIPFVDVDLFCLIAQVSGSGSPYKP